MATFWVEVSEEMQLHFAMMPQDLTRARGFFLKYANLLWDEIMAYQSKRLVRVPGRASFDLMKSLYLLLSVRFL